MKKKNILLIILCIILVVMPFVVNKNGAFEGADSQADELIGEINPHYEPWFESFWTPPSGEVESFLFATQAAIGAGFIGYFVGKKKGQSDKANKSL
ncbi:energy-coupling factor ABC transporter substrate-binding protein [Clostridium sp.]|uniref:energy-coupling factor ABC transporter substrate-binding protein n=1 Tax=Clostridium sp. TaxID=1506 RepID=UPI002FCB377B